MSHCLKYVKLFVIFKYKNLIERPKLSDFEIGGSILWKDENRGPKL
jgi:hypothetical protein